MKTFTKIFRVIAIGAVIVIGLNGCITVTPYEKTEEEMALEQAMKNASWEMESLADPPSLTDLVKLSSSSIEYGNFRGYIGGTEGNTWYAFTAPEIPGITYYYYKKVGEAINIVSVYKKK
jgi:hypothetical protein